MTNTYSWITPLLSGELIKWLSLIAAGIGTLWAMLFAAIRFMARNKEFSEPVIYVIRGFFHQVTQNIIFKNSAAYFSLRRYCRIQLSGTSNHLHVPGKKDLRIDIDKIFVPLTLEQGGNPEHFDHTNILSVGQRIRIIGDPGSGKSSIAKRLFRDECRKGDASPTRARFPVLLELRKISFKEYRPAGKPGKTNTNGLLDTFLLKIIRDEIQRHVVYEIERCLRYYLAADQNGILILLDGLDEVSSEDYPKAEAAINELCQVLSYFGASNAIILTMRTQFHQQVSDAYGEALPTLLRLMPFSAADIYSFLDRWNFGKQSRAEQISRIYNELTDHPTLRELCGNPLILAMYVAHDQASGYPTSPESRTEFYTRVADELLMLRRARSTKPPEGQKVIRELRQKILGRIAFQHLVATDQPANLIPWKDAIAAVKTITKNDTEACEQLLREVAVETGLVTEEKEGETCYFIHLTFCEFFAAVDAIQTQRDGWRKLLARYRQLHSSYRAAERSRLVEVIPFACALVYTYKTHEVISQIAEIDTSRLLALAFLESKAYDHPIWNDFVNQQKQDLLSGLAWEPDRLTKLHLFILVCIDANRTALASARKASIIDVDSFIRQLASHYRDNIFALINEYARQDAVAAFRLASLCHVDILLGNPLFVVKNCLQPAFLAMALDRISKDSDRLRWSSAVAEAGLTSLLVAKPLHLTEKSPWTDQVDKISTSERWFIEPLIPRTAFTECVTYCLNSSDVDPVFELLSKLKAKRPPGGRYILNFFARFRSIAIAVIWTTCLACAFASLTIEESIWVFFEPYVSRSTSRMIVAAMFLSFTVGIFLTAILMMVRSFFDDYAKILWVEQKDNGVFVSLRRSEHLT